MDLTEYLTIHKWASRGLLIIVTDSLLMQVSEQRIDYKTFPTARLDPVITSFDGQFRFLALVLAGISI